VEILASLFYSCGERLLDAIFLQDNACKKRFHVLQSVLPPSRKKKPQELKTSNLRYERGMVLERGLDPLRFIATRFRTHE